MNELIDLRRQLIQGHLAQDQTREIKRHITVRLDWGNEWVPENAALFPYGEWLRSGISLRPTNGGEDVTGEGIFRQFRAYSLQVKVHRKKCVRVKRLKLTLRSRVCRFTALGSPPRNLTWELPWSNFMVKRPSSADSRPQRGCTATYTRKWRRRSTFALFNPQRHFDKRRSPNYSNKCFQMCYDVHTERRTAGLDRNPHRMFYAQTWSQRRRIDVIVVPVKIAFPVWIVLPGGSRYRMKFIRTHYL